MVPDHNMCYIFLLRNDVLLGINQGSTSKTIVSGPGFQPQAVAVDWLKRKVYWTNGANDKIERSNLDGTGRETVLTGTSVRGLSLDPTSNNVTTYLTIWFTVVLSMYYARCHSIGFCIGQNGLALLL